MLSLDTAYRSFGGEVEASSTPTICRLPDSRRHQLSAIAHHGLIEAANRLRSPKMAKSRQDCASPLESRGEIEDFKLRLLTFAGRTCRYLRSTRASSFRK